MQYLEANLTKRFFPCKILSNVRVTAKKLNVLESYRGFPTWRPNQDFVIDACIFTDAGVRLVVLQRYQHGNDVDSEVEALLNLGWPRDEEILAFIPGDDLREKTPRVADIGSAQNAEEANRVAAAFFASCKILLSPQPAGRSVEPKGGAHRGRRLGELLVVLWRLRDDHAEVEQSFPDSDSQALSTFKARFPLMNFSKKLPITLEQVVILGGPSHQLIRGTPGTGKSSVLLLKAGKTLAANRPIVWVHRQAVPMSTQPTENQNLLLLSCDQVFSHAPFKPLLDKLTTALEECGITSKTMRYQYSIFSHRRNQLLTHAADELRKCHQWLSADDSRSIGQLSLFMDDCLVDSDSFTLQQWLALQLFVVCSVGQSIFQAFWASFDDKDPTFSDDTGTMFSRAEEIGVLTSSVFSALTVCLRGQACQYRPLASESSSEGICTVGYCPHFRTTSESHLCHPCVEPESLPVLRISPFSKRESVSLTYTASYSTMGFEVETNTAADEETLEQIVLRVKKSKGFQYKGSRCILIDKRSSGISKELLTDRLSKPDSDGNIDSCSDVAAYLDKAGETDEQPFAVCYPNEAVSLEWNVVFFVRGNSFNSSSLESYVASTRAKDHMVDITIQDKIGSISSECSSTVSDESGDSWTSIDLLPPPYHYFAGTVTARKDRLAILAMKQAGKIPGQKMEALQIKPVKESSLPGDADCSVIFLISYSSSERERSWFLSEVADYLHDLKCDDNFRFELSDTEHGSCFVFSDTILHERIALATVTTEAIDSGYIVPGVSFAKTNAVFFLLNTELIRKKEEIMYTVSEFLSTFNARISVNIVLVSTEEDTTLALWTATVAENIKYESLRMNVCVLDPGSSIELQTDKWRKSHTSEGRLSWGQQASGDRVYRWIRNRRVLGNLLMEAADAVPIEINVIQSLLMIRGRKLLTVYAGEEWTTESFMFSPIFRGKQVEFRGKGTHSHSSLGLLTRAERVIYEELASLSSKCKPLLSFHKFRIKHRQNWISNRSYEIDFLCIHPVIGVVIIEVRAGSVSDEKVHGARNHLTRVALVLKKILLIDLKPSSDERRPPIKSVLIFPFGHLAAKHRDLLHSEQIVGIDCSGELSATIFAAPGTDDDWWSSTNTPHDNQVWFEHQAPLMMSIYAPPSGQPHGK